MSRDLKYLEVQNMVAKLSPAEHKVFTVIIDAIMNNFEPGDVSATSIGNALMAVVKSIDLIQKELGEHYEN